MAVLADIKAKEHLVVAVHIASPRQHRLGRRSGVDCRQPRYEKTYPQHSRWSCPYRRSDGATRPGDTPGSFLRQGQQVIPDQATEQAPAGDDQRGSEEGGRS
jgi:hypothetical protein